MNFSEPVRAAAGLVSFSPDSLYIASVSQHKISVRLSKTLQVCQLYNCVDVIYSFAWSPDSLFLLCVLKKRGLVQVLSIENPDWICKVDEGSAGVLSAEWAPDSRHFLTTTEFHLRITVWSLSEVSVSYLKYVKACTNNLAFSPGGRYLALLERRDYRDHLSLFDCQKDWSLMRNTQLYTQDAAGLLWSPDGRYIVVWDECLRYRVTVHGMDGRCLHSYCAYEPGQDLLGVKSVCWSPTGQLLAIGSYDQKCRILNHLTWACLATLTHPVDKSINPYLGLSPTGRVLQADSDNCQEDETPNYRPHRIDAYEERRLADTDTVTGPITTSPAVCQSGVAYCLVNKPIMIQSIRVDPKVPFPKIGVGLMSFSTDGRFLATRNDNAPSVVWVWSIDHRLSLFSLLVHTSGPVSAFVWDPSSPARLALCTGSDCVFMWTPQGCLAVQTPTHFNFAVTSLAWLPSGDALLLKSDSQFCLCYLDSEDEANNPSRPLWKPPHQTTYRSELLVNVDSPLPTGTFGLGDVSHCESVLEDSISDCPNWLRQHAANQQDGRCVRQTGDSVGRRPRPKAHDGDRAKSISQPCRRPPSRDRPVVSSTTSRQAWNAPLRIASGLPKPQDAKLAMSVGRTKQTL
ncbi:hypothetical protein EG68_04881 [Paragonimus skrjabini miyazakii]|uniref:Translation initiation factor beta propellor-like domain-containing protein n=1 Tax=Paragonimus skrjabini miyazakii TaxID=59628 RepID=A0A8S9Z1H3_9TREM|nr:hypothetical protein EG68_04881 [Paragonimus skrjabini miyazakii]